MDICFVLFSGAEGFQEDVRPKMLKHKPDADVSAKEGNCQKNSF